MLEERLMQMLFLSFIAFSFLTFITLLHYFALFSILDFSEVVLRFQRYITHSQAVTVLYCEVYSF